ncbi:hypothetical protein Pcinc_003163 [Petrolisthes cinctipes]|uniref:Uncharacterized protein n=1 Tax=Petrolisthes cinctipes TaxID=88211 RepID=A0AAE1GJU8_PETCI|nr:hypothetical protein Pcinc_003163 [Petrolisthes cinctipes]
MKEDLQASNKLVMELEERCNYLEDHSRRNNLQIVGLEERPEGETWEQTAVPVSKLLKNKLELPNLQMERAHRTKLVIKQRMSAPQHEGPTRTSHSSRPSSLNPPPPGGRDSGSEAWPQLSVPGAVSSVDSAIGVSGSPAGVAAVVAAPDVTATLGAVGGNDVAVSPSLKAGVCSGEKRMCRPFPQ